jgi:hypothetical protein
VPEGATGQFTADLGAAAASGSVWFIYGERSTGLEALRRVLRRLPPEVRRSIHLEVVPGIELAGFRSLPEQQIAIDRVVRLVGEVAESILPGADREAEVGARWRRGG